MEKSAPVEHDVHPLVSARWSPRAFRDEEVSPDALRSLLEAARWAPSAYNEQPWRFIVARRQDGAAFERMVELLQEGNRAWARQAAVLLIAVAKRRYSHDGSPNAHAWHDLGQASAWLTVEATGRGLAVHQMAGIRHQAIREAFGIPEDHEPVTALAIGVAGEPEQLEGDLARRERAPRRRKPQEQFVFSERWQQTWAG